MDMAKATWNKLNEFAREKGLCCKAQDPDWATVAAFINVGYDLSTNDGWYNNVRHEISNEQLRLKIGILGVPWRSPNERSRP